LRKHLTEYKISAKYSLGLHEWQHHKPHSGEECSQFIDQRKEAKIQWLQAPNYNNDII
jgi:hypothetical protein